MPAPKPSPLLFLLILAATTLLASRASAAQVVVVVGGDADQATRKKLTEAVADGLREHRADLGERALRPADVDALIECVADVASQDCAAKFMETTKAARAIVMRVVRDRTGATTIYGWVIATAGATLVVNQRVCEHCNSAQLASSARALLDVLLKDVETRTMPATLTVRTTPPGAQVEIDGRIVGVTPLDHGVYAGRHRVVLHLRGYEDSIQTREILAGETTTVDVDLKPAQAAAIDQHPPDEGEVTPPRPSRWKPWTVIGAGATIAIAGGVLVAIDRDNGGDGGLQYEHRNTAAIGLGGMGVGAAVTAVGVIWLLREDDARKPKRSAPTVLVDRDQVLLGYGGSF